MKQNKLDTIKTSGFKIPEDYFSQVEEEILSEVKLIEKANHSGFEVPESYFDSVEHKILSQITSENDSKVVSIVSWRNVIYASAVAATLVLMFNVFFNTSENLRFEDIEMASIENYLEQEDYTTYELASLLTEEELSKDNFIEQEISEDSLEDYLFDTIEIEDLIIEQTQ